MRLTRKRLDKAKEELERAQKGARARTLMGCDIEAVADSYRHARRVARKLGVDPDSAKVEMDGGAVANSYKYRAESSFIQLDSDGFCITRGRARSRPYGDNGRFRTSIACPEGKRAKDIKAPFGIEFTKMNGRLSW